METQQLTERLDGVMLRDRKRIERRLASLRRGHEGARQPADDQLARLTSEIDAAEARVAARRAAVPKLE